MFTAESILLAALTEIEEETPFTALDYFTVDKTTFVSIISTVLTYFFILLQLNLSNVHRDRDTGLWIRSQLKTLFSIYVDQNCDKVPIYQIQ